MIIFILYELHNGAFYQWLIVSVNKEMHVSDLYNINMTDLLFS